MDKTKTQGNVYRFWPTRKDIDPDLSKIVEKEPNEQRKFCRFNLTQTQLRDRLSTPGSRIYFTGEVAGTVTVDIIEDMEGRDVVNDKVYRFTGRTDNGFKIKVHIWFSPATNENESERTCIFVNFNQNNKDSEPHKIQTRIRFVDGLEKVRDDTATFATGGTLNLRIQTQDNWPTKSVTITSRNENDATGEITFRVRGDGHKTATVVLNTRDPMSSEIIFDE
jgi:hypothetical protein